jgi:hypothetical protein
MIRKMVVVVGLFVFAICSAWTSPVFSADPNLPLTKAQRKALPVNKCRQECKQRFPDSMSMSQEQRIANAKAFGDCWKGCARTFGSAR